MNERVEGKELELRMQQAWVRLRGPKILVVPRFTHMQTGAEYVVEGMALRESDLAPMVMYAPLPQRSVVFARPLDEFLERFGRTAGLVSVLGEEESDE